MTNTRSPVDAVGRGSYGGDVNEHDGLSLALDERGLRLRRPSAAEQAAEAVRDLILRRALAPGETLRETELAAALGISRNTLREALRMVAREGLIVQGARRVATVAALSLEDVDDIIATRTLIECGAIDLLRRPARELGRLREALDALVRAPETDWQAVIDADRAFHTTLVGLAASPRLDAAYAQLDAEIRRTMSITTRAYASIGDLQAEHADIVDALARRAYAQAKALLRGHFAVDAATLGQVLRGDAAPPHTPSSRGVKEATPT
jgi:DNA-binding GntR family transcriptional regulator